MMIRVGEQLSTRRRVSFSMGTCRCDVSRMVAAFAYRQLTGDRHRTPERYYVDPVRLDRDDGSCYCTMPEQMLQHPGSWTLAVNCPCDATAWVMGSIIPAQMQKHGLWFTTRWPTSHSARQRLPSYADTDRTPSYADNLYDWAAENEELGELSHPDEEPIG